MRKVFDFLVFLLFVYGIFVTIDCFRLKAADDLKRPFVILKSEEEVLVTKWFIKLIRNNNQVVLK